MLTKRHHTFLAFHGHLKSDVIVVGFNAIHSGVLSSHHGLWDRFFINGFN